MYWDWGSDFTCLGCAVPCAAWFDLLTSCSWNRMSLLFFVINLDSVCGKHVNAEVRAAIIFWFMRRFYFAFRRRIFVIIERGFVRSSFFLQSLFLSPEIRYLGVEKDTCASSRRIENIWGTFLWKMAGSKSAWDFDGVNGNSALSKSLTDAETEALGACHTRSSCKEKYGRAEMLNQHLFKEPDLKFRYAPFRRD